MEKPFAEFRLNSLPAFIYVFGFFIPFVVFYKLLPYNLFFATTLFLLTGIYVYWVIKSEENYTFKAHTDKLEGKINGNMYKINISEVSLITIDVNTILFYGLNKNILLKVKINDTHAEFINVLKKLFPINFKEDNVSGL